MKSTGSGSEELAILPTIFANKKRLWLFLFVALVLTASVIIPATPDELSRLQYAQTFLSGWHYDFHWPLATMVLPVIVEFVLDGEVATLRWLNSMLIVGCGYIFVNRMPDSNVADVLVLVSLPALALLTATSTPQSLIVAWGLLLLAYNERWAMVVLTVLLLLTNPALGPLFGVLSVFLIWRRGINFVLSYLFFVSVIVGLLSLSTIIFSSHYSITMSSVGPVNLYLGNNADPLSFRGFARPEYSGYCAEYVTCAFDYIQDNPMSAVLNWIKKLVFYFLPFDSFRSEQFAGPVSLVFMLYVAVYQVILYVTLFFQRHKIEALYILIAYLLMSVVYSIFFIKLRFRLPLDILFAAAICFLIDKDFLLMKPAKFSR